MPALKKTPANSHAPEQQPEQPQMRVAMLPAPGMGTIYANAFQTTFARGEILLTACVSVRKTTSRARCWPSGPSRPSA